MKYIPLSKTTSFIVDNRGKTAPTANTGIPLIATNCINNRDLYPQYIKLRYVSKDTYNSWFRSHPIPGDIIFTLKGSQNGAVCLTPDPVDFVIAQDMVALRINDKVINSHYLFAALRSDSVQRQIKNLDVSGVIPHLKKTDFNKLMIPYPEKNIQKAIGDIYLTLCIKIDLLQRQNKTLEAMVETLFRQWFVEEADNSWDWCKIGDHVEVLRGLSYKGAGLTDKKNGIPMHNLNSVFEGGGYKYEGIKYYSGTYKERHIVQAGDVIITNTEQGHDMLLIGFPAIVPKFYGDEGIFSQHIYKLKLKNKTLSEPFLLYLLKTFDVREQISGSTNGSTVNMLPVNGIEWAKFRMPPVYKITAFTEFAKHLFEKKETNYSQLKKLERIRDTLLPKLMNGKIRVQL